jgi:hypothetical protein
MGTDYDTPNKQGAEPVNTGITVVGSAPSSLPACG